MTHPPFKLPENTGNSGDVLDVKTGNWRKPTEEEFYQNNPRSLGKYPHPPQEMKDAERWVKLYYSSPDESVTECFTKDAFRKIVQNILASTPDNQRELRYRKALENIKAKCENIIRIDQGGPNKSYHDILDITRQALEGKDGE